MRQLYTFIFTLTLLSFTCGYASHRPSATSDNAADSLDIIGSATAITDIVIADSLKDSVTDSTLIDSLMADSLMADSLMADSTLTLTVQERIDKLLETDMFQTSQLGLMAYDLTADTVIYAHGERQTLRPASTMKLLTAITALDKLGGSYRYATTLLTKGTIQDGSDTEHKNRILVGDIIVKGGMDPRFGTDDMRAFVEAIEREHIDTIYGNILADLSFKDADRLGEGWCWDDDNPVLTPLLWNRRDQFIPKYQQLLREAGVTILPYSDIPVDTLGNAIYANSQAETRTLCTRYHTIEQIMQKMMKDSDNLYAESMFYQIAASQTPRSASARQAIAVMKQLIKRCGLTPSRYRIADGSGLSLYNYQTAELQIQLLRYAYRNANIYESLYPSLPIAGVDGTLKKRMRNTTAYNNVHAKTGTLAGVSSLSGYLTAANGNVICFAILNQGIMHTSNAKQFQDKICVILSQY